MFNEEFFGPVIALIRAKDEEEAIELANDSKFSLGGANVFTKNTTPRGENIAARKLQAVVPCAINTLVKSDPRLPFGASKILGTGES